MPTQPQESVGRGTDAVRVGLIYGDYPPKPAGQADGGADFMQQLARRMVARGIGMTAIVSKRVDRPTPFVDEGVCVEPVIEGWRLRNAVRGELTRLRHLISKERINLLHVIYPDPYLRYGSDSYHLPFALKALGLPLVVTFFGFGVTRSGIVTKAGLLELFALSDALVITDWDLVPRFKKRFPFWGRKVTGGFVGSIAGSDAPRWSADQLARRRAALGYPPDHRYVGFFGFWLPGKGLEQLIQAMVELRNDSQPVRLVLIGGREAEHRTEYEANILNEIRDAGVQDAVIQTGPLTADQVSAHLVAMDVCVLPFQANPLGRSSLALSLTLGVPTMVTRPREGAHVLEGLPLLDEPVAAHIVAGIRPILDSQSVQQKYAQASVAASRYWSWDSVVTQYEKIYEQVRPRQ